jgi:triacylglycerol lipase
VPADIAAELKKIGRVVDPPGTAKLYRKFQPNEPYKDVSVKRDVSFGPDAKNVIDIFSPEKGGGGRTVFIMVPGGAGNKRGAAPDGDGFYDNMGLWAVKNGMVGITMQRRATTEGQGAPGLDVAGDVGKMLEWVQKNIAQYKGNGDRVFLWAHSAGNRPVVTYLSHPQLFTPKGVGLKGVVLTSGGAPWMQPNMAKIAYFLGAAELDPQGMVDELPKAKDELCKQGLCPAQAILWKDHSHMSEVYAVGSPDESTSGPVLKWMKGVK